MYRTLFLFLLFVVVGSPGIAQDQEAVAVPVGDKVNDHFDEASKTSGGVLVGLRLGIDGTGQFDPDKVHIALPEAMDQTICVRGVSRDGRYWTRTPYRIKQVGLGHSRLRLEPVSREQYHDLVRAYERIDMAFVAYSSSDANCFEDPTEFLPEMPDVGNSDELKPADQLGIPQSVLQVRIHQRPVPGSGVGGRLRPDSG